MQRRSGSWGGDPGLRAVAAAIAGMLGYFLVPTAILPNAPLVLALLRGVLAAIVVAVTLRGDRRWWMPAIAAACAGAGASGLLTLGFGAFSIEYLWGLPVAVACAVAFHALQRRLSPVAGHVFALAVVLGAGLVMSGVAGGPLADRFQDRKTELASFPVANAYDFDGLLFLHTLDLMKSGESYYPAFRQAVLDDLRLDETSLTSPFNYREPFVFLIWKWLPGDSPYDLLIWFFVFGTVASACAYFLASALVDRGPALLAPIGMLSYITLMMWWKTWFTMTEIWAAFFAVAALMALVRGWRTPSLVLLWCAVAAREFMLLLIPAWLVWWWLSTGRSARRATWWFPVLSVAVPAGIVLAHIFAAPATGGGALGLGDWMHGGLDRLNDALLFSWRVIPDTVPWMVWGVSLLALAGAATVRPGSLRWTLLAVIGVQLIFLLAISKGEPSRYWGAYYTPLAIAVLPAVFSRITPPEVVAAGRGRRRPAAG